MSKQRFLGGLLGANPVRAGSFQDTVLSSGDIGPNYVLQSEDLTTTWTTKNTPQSITNDGVDGGINFDRIVLDGPTSFQGVEQTFNVTYGTSATWTASVHFKKGTYDGPNRLRIDGDISAGTAPYANLRWDWSGGVPSVSAGFPTSGNCTVDATGITDLGGGIYRAYITLTNTSVAGTDMKIGLFGNHSGSSAVAGEYALFGGAQVVLHDAPGDYAKTTTSTVNTTALTSTTVNRVSSNVGILSLDEAGPEANGSNDLTQFNWGGIRGRDALIGATAAVEGDDYWDDTVLLLRAEDNVTDATGRHTVTAGSGGYSTSVPFATSNTKSFNFNGLQAHKHTIPNSTDFHFGSDPFTIEYWLRWDGTSGLQGHFQNYGTSSDSLFCGFGGAATALRFYISSNGTSWDMASASDGGVGTFSSNTWYHIALVRESGGDIWCYKDGVKGSSAVYSGTAAIHTNSTDVVAIGGDSSLYEHHGQLDEIRVTKGVARYTSNFTPQTEPHPEVQTTAATPDNALTNTGILSLNEALQSTYS